MEKSSLFQNYLVIFIDILGQRNSLRQIKRLPTNEEENEKFISGVKETLGKVESLRGSFEKYFDSLNAENASADLVPKEYTSVLKESQKSEVYYYGISDSLIIAVPLINDNENCKAIRGVYAALIATCGIGLIMLSEAIVIRGGLDVGIATRIGDKEIYGPALERAYFFENTLAEYPRFLVGNELMQYLLSVEQKNCSTMLGSLGQEAARSCKKLIIHDCDGRLMLDFLGVHIKEILFPAVIDEPLVEKAFNFVNSQCELFSEDNNFKLSSYYHRLLSYFKSRLSIWK